jgi:uncharacterized membrane protein
LSPGARSSGGRLGALALATHLGLVAAVIATFAIADLGMTVRLGSTALGVLPLAAALPGLLRGRRAGLPWLALALVAYAGLGTVEVMASGTSVSVALLGLALLELGLVLALIRAPKPRSPDATRGS